MSREQHILDLCLPPMFYILYSSLKHINERILGTALFIFFSSLPVLSVDPMLICETLILELPKLFLQSVEHFKITGVIKHYIIFCILNAS